MNIQEIYNEINKKLYDLNITPTKDLTKYITENFKKIEFIKKNKYNKYLIVGENNNDELSLLSYDEALNIEVLSDKIKLPKIKEIYNVILKSNQTDFIIFITDINDKLNILTYGDELKDITKETDYKIKHIETFIIDDYIYITQRTTGIVSEPIAEQMLLLKYNINNDDIINLTQDIKPFYSTCIGIMNNKLILFGYHLSDSIFEIITINNDEFETLFELGEIDKNNIKVGVYDFSYDNIFCYNILFIDKDGLLKVYCLEQDKLLSLTDQDIKPLEITVLEYNLFNNRGFFVICNFLDYIDVFLWSGELNEKLINATVNITPKINNLQQSLDNIQFIPYKEETHNYYIFIFTDEDNKIRVFIFDDSQREAKEITTKTPFYLSEYGLYNSFISRTTTGLYIDDFENNNKFNAAYINKNEMTTATNDSDFYGSAQLDFILRDPDNFDISLMINKDDDNKLIPIRGNGLIVEPLKGLPPMTLESYINFIGDYNNFYLMGTESDKLKIINCKSLSEYKILTSDIDIELKPIKDNELIYFTTIDEQHYIICLDTSNILHVLLITNDGLLFEITKDKTFYINNEVKAITKIDDKIYIISEDEHNNLSFIVVSNGIITNITNDYNICVINGIDTTFYINNNYYILSRDQNNQLNIISFDGLNLKVSKTEIERINKLYKVEKSDKYILIYYYNFNNDLIIVRHYLDNEYENKNKGTQTITGLLFIMKGLNYL